MRRAMLAIFAAVAACPVAMGARPLIIDDVEPVARGKLQLEMGLSWFSNSQTSHFDAPAVLTYGVADHLELGVGLGWRFERREDILGGSDHENGIGDLVLATKWNFLQQESAALDQSLWAAINFPTASHHHGPGSGKADFDLMWIGTRRIGQSLFVDVNLGYTWTGESGRSDVLHYGLAARHILTKNLAPVMEIAANKEVNSARETVVEVNAGVQWTVKEGLVLDAAVGTTIVGDGPDVFLTVGFTWQF